MRGLYVLAWKHHLHAYVNLRNYAKQLNFKFTSKNILWYLNVERNDNIRCFYYMRNWPRKNKKCSGSCCNYWECLLYPQRKFRLNLNRHIWNWSTIMLNTKEWLVCLLKRILVVLIGRTLVLNLKKGTSR